ncbi:MAG: Gfo/Idh/MocA family oxidoreductase [Desulfomonile tiedjei]|nr:Gfo/Idh/MocA family oxidoreductase [Desulfomonile tiedjei]
MRIGILGAGSVVEQYHLPVLSAMPEVQVEWVCDIVKEQAVALGKTYGVRRSYSDLNDCPEVDIVLVAIPVGVRRPSLEVIFERKWNVFCEKPFAGTAQEHGWIMKRAKEQKVEVGVGMMRRFYDATVLARKLAASGMFGSLQEVWASEGLRQRGTGRDMNWYQANADAAGGGVLMETGCHLVDQVATICSARSYKLEACAMEYRGGLDYAARLRGSLEIAQSQTCSFRIALSKTEDIYNGIMLKFADLQVRVGLTAAGGVALCDKEGKSVAALQQPEEGFHRGQVYAAFYREWREFIHQCRTRTASLVHADSVCLTTRLIEECYELQPRPRQDDGRFSKYVEPR